MKKKNTGIIVFLLVLMFMSSLGSALSELLNMGIDYDSARSQALLFALISTTVASLFMMMAPLMSRLVNKEKLPHKGGKRICLWNSIIMFVCSSALMATTGMGFIGGVGALIFYFINKWLFVKEEWETEEELASNLSTSVGEEILTEDQENTQLISVSEEMLCANRGNNVYIEDLPINQEAVLVEDQSEEVDEIDQELAKIAENEEQTENTTACYKKQKRKFCSRCGKEIDPITKKCSGCGKQYLKVISFKAKGSALVAVLLAISVSGNILLCITSVKLREENGAQKKQQTSLTRENAMLKNDVADCQKEIKDLEEDRDYYYEYYRKNMSKVYIMDKSIVFVVDDGTNLYHKYECSKFMARNYWAYNVENAEYLGYEPCSRCCD